MITLTSAIVSDYGKLVASFLAGSAVIRAWFAKEISAGKALLAHVEAKIKADAAKVEAGIKAEVKKL